jgi:pantoate kinase
VKAKAYSPAGLSSFFKAYNNYDFRLTGAKGGGFLLAQGIETDVIVKPSKKNLIKVYINGVYAWNAITSRKAAQYTLNLASESFEVTIKHKIDVPIAAGFGASGAGALTTALALSKILNLKLSMEEVGMIAHKAEIECKTGLGTVPPLISGGGCVITVKPGGPGIAVIKRIPIKHNLKLVSGVFKPIKTKNILISKAKLEEINKAGEKALENILADPCLENFFESAKKFAIESKLTTKRVLKLINEAEDSGAIGAAQNMIGEAVHAVMDEEALAKVLAAFKKFMPYNQIIVTELSLDPVKLID